MYIFFYLCMIAYCRAALSTTSSSITHNDHHHHTKHTMQKKPNRLLALHLNMKRQPNVKFTQRDFYSMQCTARLLFFLTDADDLYIRVVCTFTCYSKYIYTACIQFSFNVHRVFMCVVEQEKITRVTKRVHAITYKTI